MKKKLLTLVLSMVLTVSALAGCGNAEGEVQSSDSKVEEQKLTLPLEEPVTMRMFAFQRTGTDLTQNLAWKEMIERTNIQWELTTVTSSDYVEKRGLSFSGGDYEDVFFKSGIGEADALKYAKEGIIIPLNDLIDQYMPNLKAALDEYDAWSYVTSQDGNIYSLPQLQKPGYSTLMLFVNQPWMEALNIENPKSWDEFVDMLRAFKTKDPNGNGEADEIPLFLTSGTISFLLPYYGIAFDGNTNASYVDGKLVYYPTSETYKAFLKEVAAMKAEGLINDYVTATWDDQAANGQTKDVMGCFLQYGPHLSVGIENERYADFPALEPWTDTMPVSSGVTFGGLVITDKCQYPELVAQWADYFYCEDGGRLLWLGVEGESYYLNDDGTYTWNLDGTYGTDMTTVRDAAGLYGDLPEPGIKPELFDAGQTSPEQVHVNAQTEVINRHLAEKFPRLNWTDSELKKKAAYVADINPYVLQYEAQVVNGEVDLDSTWDNFIKTLEEMGVKDMNAIDQAAVDRFYGVAE